MSIKDTVKDFIERHEWEIAYVTGVASAVVGMAVGLSVGAKILRKKASKNTIIVDIPNLTVKDFGKVGEEMIKKNPLINLDTKVPYWSILTPKEN